MILVLRLQAEAEAGRAGRTVKDLPNKKITICTLLTQSPCKSRVSGHCGSVFNTLSGRKICKTTDSTGNFPLFINTVQEGII